MATPINTTTARSCCGTNTTAVNKTSTTTSQAASELQGITIRDYEGKERKLGDLMARATLIVNIDCKVADSANPECRELQDLYIKYKDKGLEILAFPSDQFQYVSSQGEYISACAVRDDLAKRYHVTFPIMDKVKVNGDEAHPLFMLLQQRLSGFPTNAIKWDFTKFLIVDGEPVKRYAPTTSVASIEPDIINALNSWSGGAGIESCGSSCPPSSTSQSS